MRHFRETVSVPVTSAPGALLSLFNRGRQTPLTTAARTPAPRTSGHRTAREATRYCVRASPRSPVSVRCLFSCVLHVALAQVRFIWGGFLRGILTVRTELAIFVRMLVIAI